MSFAVLLATPLPLEDLFRKTWVSLCEVTPDSAAGRQRALASSAALECVQIGTWAARTSFRSGASGFKGCSAHWDTRILNARMHLGQHCRVLEEVMREETGQMWKELSANHWSGKWPCRNPVLCNSTCALTPCFVVHL